MKFIGKDSLGEQNTKMSITLQDSTSKAQMRTGLLKAHSLIFMVFFKV